MIVVTGLEPRDGAFSKRIKVLRRVLMRFGFLGKKGIVDFSDVLARWRVPETPKIVVTGLEPATVAF